MIDSMLEKSSQFSEEQSRKLFERFFSNKDEKELQEVRNGLQYIIATIFTELVDMSGQTEDFESTLTHSLEKLSQDISISELKDIVNDIILEAKKIKNSNKNMHKKFKVMKTEIEDLQKNFEQAKTEARVDFLTGLPNRQAFEEILKSRIDKISSENKNLCLLVIDIDFFKNFNDKYGHLTGDQVLKFVANRIKYLVKGKDFVARCGGEEFTVILSKTPLSGAKIVAESIRASFANSKLKDMSKSKDLGILTVSIGISSYKHNESLTGFFDRADKALYFAKNTGRNRVATEDDLAK